MSATTRNAMPVHSRSYVRKYTMAATIIAGISTRNSLMRIIIIKPTTTRTRSNGRLSQASPKLLKIEFIVTANRKENMN